MWFCPTARYIAIMRRYGRGGYLLQAVEYMWVASSWSGNSIAGIECKWL